MGMEAGVQVVSQRWGGYGKLLIGTRSWTLKTSHTVALDVSCCVCTT